MSELKNVIVVSNEEEFRGFLKANIYKYLHRYQHKNGADDLRKIKIYVDRLIKLENQNNEV